MFKKLLKFIFGDESSKIRNKINKKYVKAIAFQRNGNIRQYSVLMNDIADLEDEYERLQNS